MKITERENLLLRRALDKATTPAEAETAAKAFVESLRRRGINGYDFVPPEREGPPPRPEPEPQSPPPPEQEYWRSGRPKNTPDQEAYRRAQEAHQQARSAQPQQKPKTQFLGCGCWTWIAILILGSLISHCGQSSTSTSSTSAYATPYPTPTPAATEFQPQIGHQYTAYFNDDHGMIRSMHVLIKGVVPTLSKLPPRIDAILGDCWWVEEIHGYQVAAAQDQWYTVRSLGPSAY
jgi:hypothetical protein